MKILFLSSGPRCPSARFRILPFVPKFREDGHYCVVAHSLPEKYDHFPWLGFRPSQLLKRGIRHLHAILARLQRFDVVFVDREIFDNESSDMEERFRKLCRTFVLDLDDAVFLRYPEKFERLLQRCLIFAVCGNHFLEKKLASLIPRPHMFRHVSIRISICS
ncbi:MAG: hypothetical protein R3C49_05845 [Planctomycetaceae bacterium]